MNARHDEHASPRRTRAGRRALLALATGVLIAGCGGGGYGGGGGGGMGGYTAPTITMQPANSTVSAGQMATFSVTASGYGPLTYQWMKNSVDIAAATSASYTTPAVTSADNNAQFAVKVSNAYGTTTSNHAILTVL